MREAIVDININYVNKKSLEIYIDHRKGNVFKYGEFLWTVH